LATTERVSAEIESHPATEVEQGSFAPTAVPGRETSRLVIATFNIRYAVGSFLITGSLFRRAGITRPRRRAALVEGNIRRAARALSDGARMPPADIIALQEADRGTVRAGGHHISRELARALRMSYAHASMGLPRGEEPKPKQWYLNFEEQIAADDTGDTGVAILTRVSLEDVRRLELPWAECAWRPRLAMAASIRAGRKRVHVFNSHIDPHASIEEQLAQHEAVLAHARELSREEPAVLLGDFNTLTPKSRSAMRRLLESHGYATPFPMGVATWRAGLVRLHADWIFVRGARVVRWGVVRRLSVSDHWPVWVEIELATEAEEAR
jgi:endonuclease/exonuclease/phosphatase family metal-dependent hydrolase